MKFKKSKSKKILVKILMFILVLSVVGVAIIFAVNQYIKSVTKSKIFDLETEFEFENADCILVLGCGVINGKPSNMLEDRLLSAIDLYKKGYAKKIIMSGDHGRSDYDEVNVMKSYAIEKGIPSEDIFMDHAGFSTYESIYRAKYIFGVKKMIIVTQKYHLYRAVYTASKFDIDCVGVSADLRPYYNQAYREIREILARNKDVLLCIFKPEPQYLGDAVFVGGNGDITNG